MKKNPSIMTKPRLIIAAMLAFLMACSSMTAKNKGEGTNEITAQVEAEEVKKASVEIATELQGLDAVPVQDPRAPKDQKPEGATVNAVANNPVGSTSDGKGAVPEAANASVTELPQEAQGRGVASVQGERIMEYRVKNGDTLMKIAFEVLGDLTRWKEIFDLNQGKITNPNLLSKGMVLKVRVFNVVSVKKDGEPYRIKRGDTLGRISKWVYGTISKWKVLWKNNLELIHDPNWIYAGFTLYFKPDAARVPANAKPAQ